METGARFWCERRCGIRIDFDMTITFLADMVGSKDGVEGLKKTYGIRINQYEKESFSYL